MNATLVNLVAIASLALASCQTPAVAAGSAKTPDVLDRYNAQWIERSINNWPVKSRYVKGNQENGTLTWYGADQEDVGKLQMRSGESWSGVVYAGAREDVADPATQAPYRHVHVFANGKIVGYGFFVRDNGDWRLSGSWTYKGADDLDGSIDRVRTLLNELKKAGKVYLDRHRVETEVEEKRDALLRKVVSAKIEYLNDELTDILLPRRQKEELRKAKDAANAALVNNDSNALEKASVEYLRDAKERLIEKATQVLIELARPPRDSRLLSAEEQREVDKRKLEKVVQEYSLIMAQLQAIVAN